MIGKEDLNNEEQHALKVIDKRKFNSDGSLREGATLDSEKRKIEQTPIIEPAKEPAEKSEGATATAAAFEEEESDSGFIADEIPGADDPASFVNFLSTLASQAAAALGAMPHPVTGQRTVDLDTGKYWIEVLDMLREKTNGNLHVQEKRLFDGLLSDLQMQYVALARASEEKLKQQAAQKFSAKDILGG